MTSSRRPRPGRLTGGLATLVALAATASLTAGLAASLASIPAAAAEADGWRPMSGAPAPSAPGEATARERGGCAPTAPTAPGRVPGQGDPSLRQDRCGHRFYADPAPSLEAQRRAARAERAELRRRGETSAAVLDGALAANAFTLESKPGSPVTLYLDFTGDTTTGTGWNTSANGARFTSAPFDIDGNTSAFSDNERAAIVRVWQLVAEDYAPFDVNVTTRDFGAAAIERSGTDDTRFGAKVVITKSNPVYTGCACGGLAYVDAVGFDGGYYQPGFVFTRGVGTSSKTVGEAASHEAGHMFGLSHDGYGNQEYARGADPWVPVMGSAYEQPVSQWSRGEYGGATTRQDDAALIARYAPLRADDYGVTASVAGALSDGATLDGLIGGGGDRDAFRFTAASASTVTVDVARWYPDLDVRLRIVESATGVTVATAAPKTTKVSVAVADGMGAQATFTAPPTGRVYLAMVDGIGQGDPSVQGGYSAYGSMGFYDISLSTGTPVG